VATTCRSCGRPLGVLDRVASGPSVCRSCAKQQTATLDQEQAPAILVANAPDRKSARHEYEQVLGRLAEGDASALASLSSLRGLADLSGRKSKKLATETFLGYAQHALADDQLSEEEEQLLLRIASELGLDPTDVLKEHRELFNRLLVATANAGRLEPLTESQLVRRPGEEVYMEFPAATLKEAVVREYRGGYSGVSFRIAKGVRYSTGGVRGRSVVVGTAIETTDSGRLAISSLRTVFIGTRSTIEMPYPKIASLNVFSDGLVVNLSNRKNAPMFRVESGEAVAAYMNAAFQRSDESPPPGRRRSSTASPGDDALATLERLAKLHEAGALSDEEFESKKADLLGRI
jgi:hypothetical protein